MSKCIDHDDLNQDITKNPKITAELLYDPHVLVRGYFNNLLARYIRTL